ncbi:MAG TPA: RNA methyltransferase substrate-binding domain-containing protein, partial [Pusillimonas sp.]|uniref:RNA methyltransferase substrate-binding domain-containing protein n=1 Tax=Pusillimonas sp. TaxID=3040095 RepID=UPI002D00E65F
MSSHQVLAGFHAVTARLRHAPATIRQLYVEASRRDKRMQTLVDQAQAANLRVHPVPVERLDGLARGTRHQGVVALADSNVLATDVDEVLDELEEKGATPLLLLLDGVTDPHNLGACLRTADAAGVHAVIAPRDRA